MDVFAIQRYRTQPEHQTQYESTFFGWGRVTQCHDDDVATIIIECITSLVLCRWLQCKGLPSLCVFTWKVPLISINSSLWERESNQLQCLSWCFSRFRRQFEPCTQETFWANRVWITKYPPFFLHLLFLPFVASSSFAPRNFHSSSPSILLSPLSLSGLHSLLDGAFTSPRPSACFGSDPGTARSSSYSSPSCMLFVCVSLCLVVSTDLMKGAMFVCTVLSLLLCLSLSLLSWLFLARTTLQHALSFSSPSCMPFFLFSWWCFGFCFRPHLFLLCLVVSLCYPLHHVFTLCLLCCLLSVHMAWYCMLVLVFLIHFPYISHSLILFFSLIAFPQQNNPS